MAWYYPKSDDKTHPVGAKQGNGYGLYDMHGNVWEWCEDYYQENYNGMSADGTAWLGGKNSKQRVLRGGSWLNIDVYVRSAVREQEGPNVSSAYFGFRVAAIAR
jgi:formylglycine-generating enzyme required for sulfatase activity